MSIRLSLIATILFPLTASAQFFTGPIASGIGGAGRAAVDPSEAIYLNPAAIAHLRRYTLTGTYGAGEHPVDGSFSQWSANISDGTQGTLASGALSYVRRRVEAPGGFTNIQQEIRAGVAGFAHPRLAFGLSGQRRMDLLNTGREYVQNNVNMGFLLTVAENWGFALTGNDLWNQDVEIPRGIRTVPAYGFGAHLLVMEMLRFRLDVVHPDQHSNGRNDFMGGLETYFRSDFAVRVGAQWKETTDRHFWTAGIGYKGPRLSFDYSFQKDLRTSEGSRHFIDLWIPL